MAADLVTPRDDTVLKKISQAATASRWCDLLVLDIKFPEASYRATAVSVLAPK